SDGLWNALKTAHAGDKILLAAGNYDPISLNGFNFDGSVTVQSADNNHEAVLTGLKIMNSSGLTFSNLNMAVSGQNAGGAFVWSSSDITLSNLNIHGA